jgi:uncharacterized protein YciI
MTRTFTVFRPTGSAWVQGTPVRQQPYWDEHAAFMDNLFDQGVIVLAGPYPDGSGALLIVEAESQVAVRDMFADDPWMVRDILRVGDVKEWTIFLRRQE